jgi:hypothetical protein
MRLVLNKNVRLNETLRVPWGKMELNINIYPVIYAN